MAGVRDAPLVLPRGVPWVPQLLHLRSTRPRRLRSMHCRLQLLSTLLPVIGMAGKGGGDGFQLDAVMEFVGAAFGNSNADVRAAAVLLTLQVSLVL